MITRLELFCLLGGLVGAALFGCVLGLLIAFWGGMR